MVPDYSSNRRGTTWTNISASDAPTGTLYYREADYVEEYYSVTSSGSYEVEAEEIEIQIIIAWTILWVISAYQIILRKLIEIRMRGPPIFLDNNSSNQ